MTEGVSTQSRVYKVFILSYYKRLVPEWGWNGDSVMERGRTRGMASGTPHVPQFCSTERKHFFATALVGELSSSLLSIHSSMCLSTADVKYVARWPWSFWFNLPWSLNSITAYRNLNHHHHIHIMLNTIQPLMEHAAHFTNPSLYPRTWKRFQRLCRFFQLAGYINLSYFGYLIKFDRDHDGCIESGWMDDGQLDQWFNWWSACS